MKQLWMLFFVTLISCIPVDVCAQTKTIKKKKIEPTEQTSESEDAPKKKKKDSKTVQVFEEVDDYTAPGIAAARKIEEYNILKINPFGAIVGMYAVSYERVVNPMLSGEITLGLTKLNELYQSFSEIGNGAAHQFFSNSSIVSAESGLVLGFAARYYVGKRNHIPEGSYLAAGFQTRNYQFTELAYIQPQLRGEAAVKSSLAETDLIRLMFGYQGVGDSGISWDFYVGGAYRKLTSNGPYTTSTQFFNGQRTLSTGPAFLVGCKIGMAF